MPIRKFTYDCNLMVDQLPTVYVSDSYGNKVQKNSSQKLIKFL